jgi:2-amino-4-hydroxy-6-hydroxymethyldihydropteridine diphosphokinase
MRGYLALGSNLGDRAEQITAALDALASSGVRVLARSALYVTEPVGAMPSQPAYVNAAARIETELEPDALLRVLKKIERDAGRVTDPESADYIFEGPRPIDLDIALIDGVAIESEQLVVPHPRMLDRRFVLIPLLELDFELQLPDGTRLTDALAVLPLEGQDVRRFA